MKTVERPERERERAITAIRALRDEGELPLRYKSTAPNPCRSGALIEIYADDRREYWVDPETDLVIQMDPYAGRDTEAYPPRPEDRRPVAELRTKAILLAERHVPGFREDRAALHPLEAHKDRLLYFFRWDDFSHPVAESDMPPFVQVGLRADGALVSYTNSISVRL